MFSCTNIGIFSIRYWADEFGRTMYGISAKATGLVDIKSVSSTIKWIRKTAMIVPTSPINALIFYQIIFYSLDTVFVLQLKYNGNTIVFHCCERPPVLKDHLIPGRSDPTFQCDWNCHQRGMSIEEPDFYGQYGGPSI